MRESYYLTYEERKMIERALEAGMKPAEIAKEVNVHLATMYREMQRGAGVDGKRYSADAAQRTEEANFKRKGRRRKEA